MDNKDLVPYQGRLQQTPKPKALTRHQKATLYFAALRHIEALLRSVGFDGFMDRHTGFTVEMGEFTLEMEAKESPMMAHVTSFPGYEYDPKKINAKVEFTSPARPGEYVIQVIATASMMTQLPVYVIISENSADPLREAFVNALMAARTLMRRYAPDVLRKVEETLTKTKLEGEFEKLRESEQKLLNG